MDSQTVVEDTDVELSCREAELVLNVIPLERDTGEMNEVELAALRHYARCGKCKDKGIAKFINCELSHKDIILVWARNPGDLRYHWGSLLEKYVAEHIFGRDVPGLNTGQCQEWTCQRLGTHWSSHIPSTSNDAPGGLIGEFPVLLDIFFKSRWSLDELFVIQEKRIGSVLEDIKNGEVTVGAGRIHHVDELVSELKAHVKALQRLASLAYFDDDAKLDLILSPGRAYP